MRKIVSVFAALTYLMIIGSKATVAAPDACGFIDQKDAGKTLGVPVTRLLRRTLGPSVSCTMRTPKITRFISITAFEYPNAAAASAAFKSMVSQWSALDNPTVGLQGIGDAAFRIGPNVYAQKGTHVVTLNVVDGSIGDAKAAKTIALAKRLRF